MTRGEDITLAAADGHRFGAYLSHPEGTPRGAVVLLQEIFGVNAHVRHVADFFASHGWLAIAPAMFDRAERGAIVPYADVQRGLALANSIGDDALVADLQASVDAVGYAGPVAAVGFCWGGALAWLAAARCRGLSGAVAYYGSRIVRYCEALKPAVPVLYHFGALDKSLPPEAIAKIRASDSDGTYHLYEAADHAFTNSDRDSYSPAAAQLAHRRTLDFLDQLPAPSGR